MELADQVMMTHWATRVYLETCKISCLSGVCLTRINTLLNQIKLKEEQDISLRANLIAELLYLRRKVDLAIYYKDTVRSLHELEVLHKESPESKIITKYYVKALAGFD